MNNLLGYSTLYNTIFTVCESRINDTNAFNKSLNLTNQPVFYFVMKISVKNFFFFFFLPNDTSPRLTNLDIGKNAYSNMS